MKRLVTLINGDKEKASYTDVEITGKTTVHAAPGSYY